MVFYLRCLPEVREISTGSAIRSIRTPTWANVEYYLARTSHGSTLSWVVHSWVLARLDRRRSWDLFLQALRSDIADIQGGTTHEGIHLGAMAGTVDLIQRCHGGVEARAASCGSTCATTSCSPSGSCPLTRPSGRHRHRPRSPRWACCLRKVSPIRAGFDGEWSSWAAAPPEWSLPPI